MRQKSGILGLGRWAAGVALAGSLAGGLTSAWAQAPAQRSHDPNGPQPVLASKPFTRFTATSLDGQRVLRVEAVASYGNLVHPLSELPDNLRRLSWRWRLDEPNPAADLRQKEGDDSPIKVCAFFDLPTSAIPFIERQLLRAARARADESLPSAAVCYVWDNRLPPGTVLDNAFTRRIRLIVLRGPEAPLRGWVSEQRDVKADFLRLFGDESTTVPPLVGVAIGADADNTKGRSLAFVGQISLE